MDYYNKYIKYKNKYIKYKNKYIQLSNQLGGKKNNVAEIQINPKTDYLIKLILLDNNLYKNVLCKITDNNNNTVTITLNTQQQLSVSVNKEFIINEIRFGRIIEVATLEKEIKEPSQNNYLPVSQPELDNNLIELLKQIWYT
jgi:hypothetical protein